MSRLRYDPGLYCVVPTKYSKSLRDASYVLVRTHFTGLLFPGRQIIQGKMAEQMAPIMPEFQYLPSDAKFLGDPIDYVVFDGYSDFRDGDGLAEDINVVLIDIKSGGARLTKGQMAIAQAIRDGRVRFETIRIDLDAD